VTRDRQAAAAPAKGSTRRCDLVQLVEVDHRDRVVGANHIGDDVDVDVDVAEVHGLAGAQLDPDLGHDARVGRNSFAAATDPRSACAMPTFVMFRARGRQARSEGVGVAPPR
jgi:hypothetical protein